MKHKVAIVGAAESTDLGQIPHLTTLGINLDAAINAIEDAGLSPSDIDGVATAGVSPVEVAWSLGIVPKWLDGTIVGGCSFMLHLRHAAAAIAAKQCSNVLITHGESGRSRVGFLGFGGAGRFSNNSDQFEAPYGIWGPPTTFTIPALRWMKTYGITEEQLAMVAVVQREWAGMHPRASKRDPITVEDVLNSEMIAYPFRKLMCCLVTDGGGALVVTSWDRARDFPWKPVYVIGAGESSETPMVSQMDDFNYSRAFRTSGNLAFAEAGITHSDVDHLMTYDAFVHTPLYALEALGFVGEGEAAQFVAERRTAPGGELPMNTNGGGLSYMHSGMYGMYAIQESVRQLRGVSPSQVDDVEVSIAHGVGGMFAAAGTVVMTNREP